jgi:hypothetical protein
MFVGCATFAFQKTIDAAGFILATDTSFDGCLDANPVSSQKRSILANGTDAFEAEDVEEATILLDKRSLPFSTEAIPAINDFITLQTGTQLTLTSIVTDVAFNQLDRNVAFGILPQVPILWET